MKRRWGDATKRTPCVKKRGCLWSNPRPHPPIDGRLLANPVVFYRRSPLKDNRTEWCSPIVILLHNRKSFYRYILVYIHKVRIVGMTQKRY